MFGPLHRTCCCLLVLLNAAVQASDEEPFVSGYAMTWSNASNQPAEFALSGSQNPAATLTIYDAYYESVGTVVAPIQPQHVDENNFEPWLNGLGYEPQTIELPTLHSGIYFLDGPELTRQKIPFLINNHDEITDVVVVYPTNTVNAYSETNGISLYSTIDGVHPPAVSFLRPQDTAPAFKVYKTRGLDRVLMEMDYTYKYIADADLESYETIAGSKLLVVPGHSEYWTEQARRNFDRFVELGGTALVLSGNAMFRKVGFDDSENPTQLTFSPRAQFDWSALDYPTWRSIGTDFLHGGNGSGYRGMRERITNPHDGWKILSTPSYLEDAGVEVGDVIHAPAAEYDGVPYTECDPTTGPVVDMDLLGFYQLDLVAFENTTYGGREPSCGAWIDFRKTPDSGRQITVGAFNASLMSGQDGATQQAVARNMIDLLLIDQADFDRDGQLSIEDINLLTAAATSESPALKFDLTADERVDRLDIHRWVVDFAKTKPGDANLDGFVDFKDFLLLSVHYGTEPAVWSRGNFDGDATVGFGDFMLLRDSFDGAEAWLGADVASVPEPSTPTLWLAVFAAVVFRLAHNRRDAGSA